MGCNVMSCDVMECNVVYVYVYIYICVCICLYIHTPDPILNEFERTYKFINKSHSSVKFRVLKPSNMAPKG